MTITIDPAGACHCLYTEAIPLDAIGKCTIRRASHVEPTPTGQWGAQIIDGPLLGPYATRAAALAAEVAYLEKTAL
jgi:hypothetical protein